MKQVNTGKSGKAARAGKPKPLDIMLLPETAGPWDSAADVDAAYDTASDKVTITRGGAGQSARLFTAEEIRKEMALIYNLLRRGKLPLDAASRMMFMLKQIQAAKYDADKLKAANKYLDEQRAFQGLQVNGPGQKKIGAAK